MYGNGTIASTSVVIHTASGPTGPYAGALLITTIATQTTCTAVSDNVNGAHTKLISIAQSDGIGELSIWKIGPLDYPVVSSITVTGTVSAGASTLTIGNTMILMPGVSDVLYTGGVTNHSASTTGTGTNSPPVTASLNVICDAKTQFVWSLLSAHTAGVVDGGSGVGSGGDINGLTSTDGNSTFAGSINEEMINWIPILPLGTGSRNGSYVLSPSNPPGTYGWAAAAVSFSQPTFTPPGPGKLSFHGSLSTFYQPFFTTIPVIGRKRPPVSIVQARLAPLVQHRFAAILQTRYQPLKAVQRTTTQLDSVPKTIDVAVTETYPYQVDVTNYLAVGDSISSVSSVLTFTSTGAVVASAWQGGVSSSGNIIQVIVNAPVLQLGQQYQLATTFTANTGKRLTVLSQLNMVA